MSACGFPLADESVLQNFNKLAVLKIKSHIKTAWSCNLNTIKQQK